MGLFHRLDGILKHIGLRRSSEWDSPTLLDEFLESPLKALVVRLYCLLIRLRGRPVTRHRRPVKVVCLSDTHGGIVPNVPPGDLLIHAGDLAQGGTASEIQEQIDWLDSLPHAVKVIVGGNHDSFFDIRTRAKEDISLHNRLDLKRVHYLPDISAPLKVAFEGRELRIFGSSNIIGSDDSSTNAFQYDAADAHRIWKQAVPLDTDILVTHGPPKHHLDIGLGCPGLLEETWRVKPKLHVFGHIHCGRGKQAVYWDDLQLAYENFLMKKSRGPIGDLLPNAQWLDVVNIIVFGINSVLWSWLMLGGKVQGGMLVNAACQDGNKGKLSKKTPIVIEI
ncbi:rhamnogalacturonate lyase C [Apiospora arundinis]